MAKPYNHHHLTYQTCYNNNSFLPLLCRSSSSVSAADLKLRPDRDFTDPSSPKVSCIGQIKRTTTTRRSSSTTLPPPPSSSATKTHGNQFITYTKLKRWFSVRNISPATTAAVSMVYYGSGRRAAPAGGANGGSCRNGLSRETSNRWSSKISCDDDGNGVSKLNISELDPPLPVVVKKLSVPVVVPSEMSLWRRRRSGGEALTALTVQHHQIHLPNPPAATV